jgi:excisionase family DNA binding protein
MLGLMDEFLTLAEVAEMELNQQTVRNWIDAGTLPAVCVGQRRVRVRRSDLDRFLLAPCRPLGPRPR